jgi:5-methylthioadenosine/S-adenosylhomocysteine deaminase
MNSNLTILVAPWIIPVVPRNTVLENHAVVIENGRILDICNADTAFKKHPNATMEKRPNHVVLPGFVNAHTHAAMCLFRGLADDLPLMQWLEDHIWPAEGKWVDKDFVADGTELAIAEMLSSGTTCFSDMYLYPDIVAKAAQKFGIRAAVGLIVTDFPSAWATGPDDYLDKGLAVHDETRSLSRVTTTLAPHAPYTVSDAPLDQVRTYADELNIPIHMHIHETSAEIEQGLSSTGDRPIERLRKLGLLNPKLIAVHMTQLLDEEIETVASHGVSVVHCPSSNAKLASGLCRVSELIAQGCNVALGTDSAASNNNLDMITEMRMAAFGAKQLEADAAALPAWQVLEMATINGAKALNQADEFGSLEAGKSADIIAIDLDHVATQPVYDPISQLVYSVSRDQVSDAWVNGNHVLKKKALKNIDLSSLINKTKDWANKISTNHSDH